jgi:hypothetical protein
MRLSGFAAIVWRNVARRPNVKTGATVPGYSGGFAALLLVLCLVFLKFQLSAFVFNFPLSTSPISAFLHFSFL